MVTSSGEMDGGSRRPSRANVAWAPATKEDDDSGGGNEKYRPVATPTYGRVRTVQYVEARWYMCTQSCVK